MSYRKLAVALITATLCSLTAQAQTADPPFWFGACAHFGQRKGTPENISLMKQAGLNALRDELYWATLEPSKGNLHMPDGYDDYITLGLQQGVIPKIILSYGNANYEGGNYLTSEEAYQAYLKYCTFVISRYKGKVKLYEVWNEWGGIPRPKGAEGTQKQYADFLNRIIPELRKIDPDAKFTAGWRDDSWYTLFAAAGGLKNLDGYVSHPYQYGRSLQARIPEVWLKRITAQRDQVAKDAGRPMPLYINEIGWPGQIDERGSSPQSQADYLARAFILARTLPEVRGMWWYDFQDDGYNHKYNEDNFGIVRPDLTPEPAYMALKDLGTWIVGAQYLGRLETSNPDVWILRWKDAAGKDLWTLWYSALDNQAQVVLKRPTQTDSTFQLTHVGRGTVQRRWGMRDWVTTRNTPLDPTQFSITLDRTPWIIRGDLQNVTLANLTLREMPELQRPGMTVTVRPQEIKFAPNAKSFDQLSTEWSAIGNWAPLSPANGKVGELSARFRAGTAGDELLLTVEVKDSVHRQDFISSDLWQGDSLQIAFHDYNAKKVPAIDDMTEISVGLTPKGPDMYRHFDQFGAVPGPFRQMTADVTRNEETKTTTYRLRVPYTVFLAGKATPGSYFGLAIAVNDNDGKVRRGALCWGRNPLVLNKNPAEFNWIMLQP